MLNLRNLFIAVMVLFASSAQAATVFEVDADRTGFFGNSSRESDVYVGTAVSGGQSFQISATGQIDFARGIPTNGVTGPEGIPTFGLGPRAFSPLQEAAVDAGGQTLGGGPNYGALIASFVPQSVLDANPTLSARNSDSGGLLSPESLFFVGSNARFTAPSDGVLFFGINDTNAHDNIGAFTVTIAPVPLPASLGLLAAALLAAAGFGYRPSKPV